MLPKVRSSFAVLLWGTAVLVVATASSCDGGPTIEQCTGGEDEDEDGLVDCADDDCWIVGGNCREVCSTIFDEDGDGMDGCEDPDCWLPDVCPELCADDGDQDGDGQDGCLDPDCWVADGDCPEVCDGSGNDEDGDGDVDCEDRSCWNEASGCPEVCEASGDEDGDGMVDCDDDDCLGQPICIPTFTRDVQPLFQQHCSGDAGACHSAETGLGGLSFDSYDDMPLTSIYCGVGVTKGACSLFRILEPSMPQDCLGCVPQADIDVIQQWVDAGIPE